MELELERQAEEETQANVANDVTTNDVIAKPVTLHDGIDDVDSDRSCDVKETWL